MDLKGGLSSICLRDCKSVCWGVGSKPRLHKAQTLTANSSCALDQKVKLARCHHGVQLPCLRGTQSDKISKVLVTSPFARATCTIRPKQSRRPRL